MPCKDSPPVSPKSKTPVQEITDLLAAMDLNKDDKEEMTRMMKGLDLNKDEDYEKVTKMMEKMKIDAKRKRGDESDSEEERRPAKYFAGYK